MVILTGVSAFINSLYLPFGVYFVFFCFLSWTSIYF